MKKNFSMLIALLVTLSASGQALSQNISSREDLSKLHGSEPPMMGIRWARGFDPNFLASRVRAARPRKSPNMTWHGGKIMTTAVTENIFCGTSWTTYSGDEIVGLDEWYQGFSNSRYAATSDEYTGTNGKVGPAIAHAGHVVDLSAASGGNKTSAILAEVCKEVTPDPSGNGYYAVYTDLPRGSSGYCAWHSYGTCGGIPVQFAFFWKLDGDPGCDPLDTSGVHTEGLAALANVSGHELSEARTDPRSGGWYDSGGAENGDKCAWTFNVPLVTFSDGGQWKIQGEWSNAAYNAGTGYADSSGLKGCLDGH
ncbi:MAG TPA: hypothetical protein VNO74_04005 [Methylomirabilota bacterium]|nr:hypothetical protein [Methylomirabilota bacterium]